ncbi:MAG: phosphoribosylformylglycinamidine synthase subunit PurS [Candidatus Omnitrophica bacterium]|nr:phosphoribosylformylglycinamidine synthase subunit PurS [Candidatus Omnitrophota bacterium]
MNYQAQVNVTLKKSVLDPQGKTVLHALHSLGFEETRDVRVGKYFEVKVEASDVKKAEEKIRKMCEKLLINPVIEQYSFKVSEG